MRTKWISLFACSIALGWFAGSGCTTSLDGRKTAGNPIGKDTITARYERPVLEVWAAVKDVLNYDGRIYSEDVMKSTVEATINKKTVWVKVQPVDDKVTEVLVQARGSFGADIALASQVDKEIALRLASGTVPKAPAQATTK